ncbi:uncharacterized protein LODBEIA_P25880 [Lodderomyces beijingensis]|uniref:CTLH/CRA C-terminal to LisH motif domain-containing protein n=1 Tax=Lodderomyces beijingensis TaxID=1775926 RepID=A0ABP0ZJP7_9ASCO
MTTSLLNSISQEINQFDASGQQNLGGLLEDSDNFLRYLKDYQADLEREIAQEEEKVQNEGSSSVSNGKSHNGTAAASAFGSSSVQQKADAWYKSSISRLKSYNSANNKLQKNVLNNPKFTVDLDEAYSYKLNIDSSPVAETNIEEALLELMPPANPSPTFLPADIEAKSLKQENKDELMKAIILHLLKRGQGNVVPSLLRQHQQRSHGSSGSPIIIDPELEKRFALLNDIVEDICVKHDLTQALGWFHTKFNESVLEKQAVYSEQENAEAFSNTEFKFHMLQFIILLNGKNQGFSYDDAVEAYFYSKAHFNKFLKHYLHEMAPLMTLILFNSDGNSGIENFSKQRNKEHAIQSFIEKMKSGFTLESDSARSAQNGTQIDFVSELLGCFKNVHENSHLFASLANDFISEFCKDLKLSSDSPLFQSILAGHIYLPSFYKYNQVQLKLKSFKAAAQLEKDAAADDDHDHNNNNNNNNNNTHNNGNHISETKSSSEINSIKPSTYDDELPFQLSDRNRFLFNNHPIFICPISREQAIPVTYEVGTNTFIEAKEGAPLTIKKEKYVRENTATTQVVVFNYCNHCALRESIWQLSKKGVDIFKCPYCYKKHKYTDVSDAFFIDL